MLGLNAAALGVDSLQSVLADPLTAQYNLTLVNMVAHALGESQSQGRHERQTGNTGKRSHVMMPPAVISILIQTHALCWSVMSDSNFRHHAGNSSKLLPVGADSTLPSADSWQLKL